MADIEFQDYVNRLIESCITNCDKQSQEQDMEKCKKCLQNVGLNKQGKIICIKDI